MTHVEILPELNFLSELFENDAPNSQLLAEYPSSNSLETQFQNKSKYIIHDPFPPPKRELIKVLGPHHLMCGWGNKLGVTCDVPPPQMLLDHWENVFGSGGLPDWRPFKDEAEYVTLFPHEALTAEQQVIHPDVNYRVHSKEVIAEINCLQADVLASISPPCIVKLSHGYAGLGNFLIRGESDETKMRTQIAEHWPNATLVTNSIIENITGDFGVQFYLRRNGSIVWLGLTEQMFDQNKRWCGGIYSAELQNELFDELCRLVVPAGKHLHQCGYFGLVGIDVLRDTSNRFYLVDVNPRLTGVSPFLIASRIFLRDGIKEGLYRASCKFKGSYEQLIATAEQFNDVRVVVLSAFEETRGTSSTATICHLSVSSESQQRNQFVLQQILNA